MNNENNNLFSYFFCKMSSSKYRVYEGGIGKQTVLITLLLLSFISISFYAQEPKDTLKVLFVGNSYTHVNNLPQVVSMLSNKTCIKLITRESTKGGAKLREHWLGERGLTTKEKIKRGDFDIVVFQGHSMSTILEPDSLTKYLKLFCNYARENGAEPYFYLTWARERIPQYQKTIDSVYYSIANETKATVVLAGRAWKLARELRPDIKLYEVDGSHPSKFGTVLTAYTFIKTIIHEIPKEPQRGFSTKDINGEYLFMIYFYGDEISDIVFLQRTVESLIYK